MYMGRGMSAYSTPYYACVDHQIITSTAGSTPAQKSPASTPNRMASRFNCSACSFVCLARVCAAITTNHIAATSHAYINQTAASAGAGRSPAANAAVPMGVVWADVELERYDVRCLREWEREVRGDRCSISFRCAAHDEL